MSFWFQFDGKKGENNFMCCFWLKPLILKTKCFHECYESAKISSNRRMSVIFFKTSFLLCPEIIRIHELIQKKCFDKFSPFFFMSQCKNLSEFECQQIRKHYIVICIIFCVLTWEKKGDLCPAHYIWWLRFSYFGY